MDRIDREILRMLQLNSKLSYAEIGGEVKLSVSGVKERLRKLMEKGIIKEFVAVLNPSIIGVDLCAFIQVEVDARENTQNFISRMSELPEVQECHHVTGPFTFLLKIRVKNTQELEQFLGKTLKSFSGVMRTNSLMVLSSSKETSAVMLPELVSANAR